jgi:hypothetical protein
MRSSDSTRGYLTIKIKNLRMNVRLVIITTIVLLPIALTATAQRKKNRQVGPQEISVYREFIRSSRWWLDMPLQASLHVVHKTIPSIPGQDSVTTDITLYYSTHDFYMQAEGMEQIANDSLVVVVNHEAKMIRIYQSNAQFRRNMEKAMTAFTPDSFFEQLHHGYSAKTQEEGEGIRRITLESRARIGGTQQVKETISISYHEGSYQPVNSEQSKMNLFPVDSAVYSRLAADSAYAGRLVTAKATAGDLFFIVTGKTTQCQVAAISYGVEVPPVRQPDRVLQSADGEWLPAKGLEDYIVSKEY